jgi:hypothetical protein
VHTAVDALEYEDGVSLVSILWGAVLVFQYIEKAAPARLYEQARGLIFINLHDMSPL